MAFRIEARIGTILALAAVLASGQEAQVRHQHWRHGGAGQLQVTPDGLTFTEKGKGEKHSRTWRYQDIQELELSADTLRVLTYEDQKWELGRDREYLFDQVPEGFAESVYSQWRERLDQRFISGLPERDMQPLWEIPAKLLGRIQGSEGVVRVGEDRIVYQSDKPRESRTWRFVDIENVATADPFEFRIVTREHHGALNAGAREFLFQLKQPLEEARYNELWRRLNLSKQSDFIRTSSQPAAHAHP